MERDRLLGILNSSLKKHSGKTAIKYKDITYSYEDVRKEIINLSDEIDKLAMNVNYPIGLFFKNCPEFIVGYYALITSGTVTMLVDHSLKGAELSAIANDCHLGGFLLHKSEKDSFPIKEKCKCVLEYKNFVLMYYRNQEFNRPYEVEKLKDIISCRFSSGTTGVPKCMMYTQDNVIAAATNWKSSINLNEEDKILCVANYTHGLAFNTSMLAPLSVGAEIHMIDSLMPRQIAKYIEKEKITNFVAFPVLYQMMSEESLRDKYDLTTLRICVSSGTILHAEIKQRFKENIGIYISDLYGVAETGLCILNTSEKIDTVGKALNGVEISIMDDDGNKLDLNEQGQIAIKSGSMAKGYYNFPGLFEERVTVDGFYLSGDIAIMDNDGYVYVKGRKQDFIDVAGKKVDPKEIEAVLLKCAGIDDVAVFGKKNIKTKLEVIYAAIVSRAGLKKEDIIEFVQPRLAPYKIPQRIIFMDELPRNSSGKILRRELIETVEEK
ncbi:class I adenylate-forming enzyme family protein [Ruminiclostridium cellobioparum]|uniref:class I adenylate-forming enzyme family protein n=1 Tax=Ruminiclostridium cellobioparum TaxID=29355 RepID=UPI0028A70BF3|nr:fatty acid--CoA ligase family protein [Ruminiclostridium cellobioparum]